MFRGCPYPLSMAFYSVVGTRLLRRVQLTDTKEEYEPSSDRSSGDKTLSGESCTFGPGQDNLCEETISKRPRDRMLSGVSTSERLMDRVLSRESRNFISKSEDDDAESVSSSGDSRSQPWENVSETTSNCDVSEIAIHSLLVK